MSEPNEDTGRRCPRCDCPDGHTQCDHCKVCPHAGGNEGQLRRKPRTSTIAADGDLGEEAP